VDKQEGETVTRVQLALCALIATELAGGTFILLRPRIRPVPPVPEFAYLDPLVAEQIRDRVAKCNTPDDWAALGELYLAVGCFPEAEACYRYAAEQEPERGDRAYQWGFALERIGKLEEANAAYARAIGKGTPPDEHCHYFIARNHLRMENAAEAQTAFAKAGKYPAARYELARIAARSGNTTEAITILDSLIAEQPQMRQPYLLRHRIEVLRDSPTAASYGDRANRARAKLATPFDNEWARLEDVYFRFGTTAELKAAEQLVGTRRFPEAETKLRAILAKEWNASALDLLAEIELQKQRPAEAVRLLREAIDRDGPSVHLLTRLGDAHEANRDMKLAVQAWTQATELGIGASVKNLHYRLGEHYQQAGHANLAKWHSSRAFLAAGHELFWKGDYANALPAFTEATQVEPTLAEAWYYVGEANRVLNKPDAARTAYTKCLQLNANHGRALAGLALLPTAFPR
jgi:tetratricopeptide (TPR) repeat protein